MEMIDAAHFFMISVLLELLTGTRNHFENYTRPGLLLLSSVNGNDCNGATMGRKIRARAAAIYEPPVISKARASVRRLLLLCTIGFCGFFVYGAMSAGKPVGMGIFTGIVFGLPVGIVVWLVLGIIRFAFAPVHRW
jgi:hypothetical protein